MPSLWEVLKTSKGLPAPNGFTALFARSLSDTYTLAEISGIPPLNLGEIIEIVDYTIYGNTYQAEGVSPDTPQEVVGSGDRTGNLFNGEIQQGGLGDTNGEPATSSARVRTDKINVTENTYYTITSNLMIRNVIAYNNGTFVSRLVGTTGNIATFSIPVGVNQIAISFKGDASGSVDITPNDLEWLMLNTGETALSYEPYGYKVNVISKGKNLFNKDNTTVYQAFINVNYFWFSTTDGSKSIRIPVEPDTTYTLSMGVVPTIFRLCESDLEDPTPTGIKVSRIIYSGDISEYTFTTSSTAKFLIFQGSSTVFDEWFNTLQLEFGTEATEYSPYVEPITTTVYLDTPLHKIGNYTDILSYSGKSVERHNKEMILTGDEEGWLLNTVITATYAFQNYELISDYKREPFTCTHMPVNANSNATSTHGFYGQRLTLCFAKSSGLSDVDKFKAYLKEQYNSGTPVKVYYVLAAPVTETVELPEIPTIQGTNIIDINTEVKPSNLKITYKSRR